jgi:hypothetical protein
MNIGWSIHTERMTKLDKKIEECGLSNNVKECDILTNVGCDWRHWIYSFESTEDFTDNWEWWVPEIVFNNRHHSRVQNGSPIFLWPFINIYLFKKSQIQWIQSHQIRPSQLNWNHLSPLFLILWRAQSKPHNLIKYQNGRIAEWQNDSIERSNDRMNVLPGAFRRKNPTEKEVK